MTKLNDLWVLCVITGLTEAIPEGNFSRTWFE